jgi:hypothetical protein
MTTDERTPEDASDTARLGADLPHEADEPAARSLRERGASLVEYALLLALIAVVCIGAVTMFGGETVDGPRGLNRSGSSIVNAGG